MMEYGINVTNKFAFLEEDVTDPEEVLQKAKDAKKEKPVVPKKPPTPEVSKPKVEPAVQVEQKSKDSNEARNRQGGGGGPRRLNYNNDKDKDNNPDDDQRERRTQGNKFHEKKERVHFQRSDDENAPPHEGYRRNGPPRGQGPRTPRNDGGGDRPARYNNDNRDRDRERKEREGDHVRNNEDGKEKGFRNNNRQEFRGPGNQQGQRGGGYRNTPSNQNFRRQRQEQDRNNVEPKTDDHDKSAEKIGNDDETPGAENVETAEKFINGPEEGPKNEQENENAQAKALERVLTLEEWRAEQKIEQPQFNLRKPGEGTDSKIYQELTPIKREVETNKEHEDKEHGEHHKEKREKTLNIEVQFTGAKRGVGVGYDRYERGGGERFNRDYRDRPRDGAADYRDRPRDGGTEYRDRQRDGPRDGGAEYRDRQRDGPRDGGADYRPRDGFSGGGGNWNTTGFKGRQQSTGNGTARSSTSNFNLESEQFPALGAV